MHQSWIPGGICASWQRAGLDCLMYWSRSIWSKSETACLIHLNTVVCLFFLTSSPFQWYWLKGLFGELKFSLFFGSISLIKLRGCLFCHRVPNSPLLSLSLLKHLGKWVRSRLLARMEPMISRVDIISNATAKSFYQSAQAVSNK